MMEKKLPKVSILLATYNQESFVGECLNSILTQDYPNFEIVIGDDCSKDATQEKLREFKNKYPEKILLLLNEKNLGITANVNRIFEKCDGKYVAFMAGDDLMLPRKLSTQVEFMEKNPDCCISYHNLEVFESGTNRFIRFFNDEKNSFEGYADLLITRGTFNGSCANMIRRDCAPDKGFDERLPIASDWLFWIETAINGGQIRYIDQVLGKYRRHENNITDPNKKRVVETIQDILNTCSIVLTKYPKYSSQAIHAYRTVLRNARHNIFFDYRKTLYTATSFGDLKSLILLTLHFITFGFWKP